MRMALGAVASLAVALAAALNFTGDEADPLETMARPVYADGGLLRRPEGYKKWVFVGSTVGPTNIDGDPEELYMVEYCGRGEIENRLKEAKALHLDRVSCTNFWSNQFRILLALAAFVLMQEIRRRAAGTSLARAQVVTLRERLFKLAARVVASARRYVLHLPRSSLSATAWRRIAISFGGFG